MNQEVKLINLKDLVLWSENPRDPIDPNAKNQDIVDKALEDTREKWQLKKLASEMGDIYDFSEIPIVVYKTGKPVVYDGNRRMILALISHGLASNNDINLGKLPAVPDEIPCNVCSEEIALQHVDRKHGNSGSWSPLQRDIFQYKFLKKPKSNFLHLDDLTGLISNNPHMDQGFVKKELFNNEKLKELGFKIEDGILKSKYTPTESKEILNDLTKKVETKKITTRESRGRVVDILEANNRKLVEANKNNSFKKVTFKFSKSFNKSRTRKTNKSKIIFFGEPLVLEVGEVNNLYRDVEDLNNFYLKQSSKLSVTFSGIIRMSLRLLCETASKEKGYSKIHSYIQKYYSVGKKNLNSDQKTLMNNQNVTEASLIQLLQTGAHNYTASSIYLQTLGMSLIIGQMLKISHGKK